MSKREDMHLDVVCSGHTQNPQFLQFLFGLDFHLAPPPTPHQASTPLDMYPVGVVVLLEKSATSSTNERTRTTQREPSESSNSTQLTPPPALHFSHPRDAFAPNSTIF
ncbi:hypothetical protein DMENIID0001_096760 [Sergentomyia squamirostris]